MPNSSPGDLGVNLPQPLHKLEPIALPNTELGGLPQPELSLPALPAYAPQNSVAANPLARTRRLHLDARLVKDGAKLPSGLVWRLFSPIPGVDGKLALIASAKGGSADFEIPAGSYLMHVGLGRAGVTKRIDIGGPASNEDIVLDAGGLRMNARVGANGAIPPDKLRFDVYSDEVVESDRRLIAGDVDANSVVALNAGSYQIVSHYGDENAEVHGEVKIEAGKVTDVTLQHSAAQLTMKLLRDKGGEAIADTAWQVMTGDGDLVEERVGAFPSMVLAEGNYLVVAKNRDKTYQRDFTVEAGKNADVELLTTDVLPAQDSDQGSGD
ncbi:hypothetical protein F6X38_07225 [Aureimonas leprariae]|uniref:Uncharacterized protein n=1 Tax=Plantimonas leprariae TaxID=2615207 RepID=A0A7V7PR39_9HYPH|nr:hypothetical protein F6X38_07225 [Aureimonas leprariae]